DVKSGKLPALMDITPRENRKPLFNFTHPYIKVPHTIFAHNDDSGAGSLADLAGRTVALEKGFFLVTALRDEFPDIKVQEHATTLDALHAVSKGEADAYIGNRAVAIHSMREALITNLAEYGMIRQTASNNAIGVRKDWPILRDILQKALNDIGPQERAAILRSWTGERLDGRPQLKLNAREKVWLTDRLSEHPELTYCIDPDWMPFERINDKGLHEGMTHDQIREVEIRLGLPMTLVPTANWSQTLAFVREGRCTLLAAAGETAPRREYLDFTRPHGEYALVVAVRNEELFIEN
ncbi:MAG: transporter substrate-binding domain-containing protein, partial [Gammaproteobacteria bacterium]|nr:transporter substrate-binding domain-containing protein [Gammaproteobacteria bacterium]